MVERKANVGRPAIVGDRSLGDADPGKLVLHQVLGRYPVSSKSGDNSIPNASGARRTPRRSA